VLNYIIINETITLNGDQSRKPFIKAITLIGLRCWTRHDMTFYKYKFVNVDVKTIFHVVFYFVLYGA